MIKDISRLSIISVAFPFSVEMTLFFFNFLNDDFTLDSYAQKFLRLKDNYYKEHLCIIYIERK